MRQISFDRRVKKGIERMIWDFQGGGSFRGSRAGDRSTQFPSFITLPTAGGSIRVAFIENSRLDHVGIRRSEDHLSTSCFRRRVPELGAPLLSRIFPAPMSTSTASPTSSIPACSMAPLPPLPISASRGSPAGSARCRASSPRTWRSTSTGCRRGGAAADRADLQALSRLRCAG